MTNTPSPTSTKERAWVWFSTDESIAKGQISVLACAEIPVAMAFFWWISQISPRPWLTLIALMAAPMLLLRSRASIELGLEWFRRYWEQRELTKRQQWVVGMIAFVITAALAYYLQTWLLGLSGWSLWWRAALLSGVAVAFAFAFAGVVVGVVVVMGAGADAVVVTGIFIRTTLIRLFATLRHLPAGIPYFSSNWRETVLVIDLFHLPMLLPRANEVDANLSLATWWKKEKEGLFDWAFFLMLTLITYPPALLYRWNIKASSLIWGLLAFVLRPVVWEEKNDDEMREQTSAITTKVAQRIGVGLGVGLLIWLNFPNKINEVAMKALGNDWLGLFGFPWTAPPVGLRYVVSMLLAGAFLAHCVFSYYLRSSHSKALEGATDYKPENKVRIHQLAKPVWFSFRLTFALAVLTVWSYALAYGLHQWPEVTQGLVWGWLRGWV